MDLVAVDRIVVVWDWGGSDGDGRADSVGSVGILLIFARKSFAT